MWPIIKLCDVYVPTTFSRSNQQKEKTSRSLRNAHEQKKQKTALAKCADQRRKSVANAFQ